MTFSHIWRLLAGATLPLLVSFATSCDRSSNSPDKAVVGADSVSQRFSVEQEAWIPDHVFYALPSDSGSVVPTLLGQNLFTVRIPGGLGGNDTLELRFLFHGVVGSIYKLQLHEGSLTLVKRTHLETIRSSLLLLDSLHAVSAREYPDDASGLRKAWVTGVFQSASGFGSFPADRPYEFDPDSVWLDAFRLVLARKHAVAEYQSSWALPHDTAMARSVAERFRSAGLLSDAEFDVLYPVAPAQPGRDSGRSVISLVSPASESSVFEAEQESLVVRVVVMDPDGVASVAIGGRDAVPLEESQYEVSVALPAAGKTDSIVVVAKDRNGVETRRTLDVRRKERGAVADTIRPKIRVLSSVDSVVSYKEDSILVRWSASDSGGIGKVLADSHAVVASDDGTYEWRFPLAVGANRLAIRVSDVAGNARDTVLKVRRNVAPAGAVVASLPEGTYDAQKRVSLRVKGGGIIRYRIGGGEPDTTSLVFKDSILLDTSVTLYARAWTAGGPGPTSTFTWRLMVGSVVLSDTSTKEHSGPFQVHASCATSGATVRYTRNGAVPNASSPEWADSIFIDSTSTYRFRAFAPGFEPGPVRTIAFKVAYVVDIATGNGNSYFLKSDGSLWVSGAAKSSGLADSVSGWIYTPRHLMDDVVQVTDGMAIRKDGSVWVWGDNSNGEAGIGAKGAVASPRRIGVCTAEGGAAKGSMTGWMYHEVMCKNGTLWAMGSNQYGSLGVGDTLDRLEPVRVARDIADVASGAGHVIAVDADGALWTWGMNAVGQLGDGTQISTSTPHKLATGEQSWVSVAANSSLSLAVSKDGGLYSFGGNYKLMAGVGGDSTFVRVPTKIWSNVEQASVGAYHAAAVDRSGIAWAWGDNETGQLGDGSNEARSRPVRITDGVAKVAAGYWWTLYLKRDGTVWATGNCENGECGLGDIRSTNVPVRVRF